MNDIVFVGEHLRTYEVNWHYHDNWELVYCTSGEGVFMFGDGTQLEYSKGDLVAIPPGLRHTNLGKEGFTNIHIIMAEPELPNAEVFTIHDDANGRLRYIFSEARYFYISEDKRRNLILSAIGALLVAFITVMRKSSEYSEPVQKIRDEIIEHFSEPGFSLDDVYQNMNFNPDYLRKLFKKETGMSPLKYMTGLRMKRAESILVTMGNRELLIAEVAEQCGYDNALYFSRVFQKHFGCAPSAFAEQYEKNKVTESEETKKY